MSYKSDRRQEVLDGTCVWHKNEVCAGDDDVFLTQYIEPLRELQAEELFERLVERRINEHGKSPILFVKISGSINLDHQLEEEE